MKALIIVQFILLLLISHCVFAQGFVSGIPSSVMKSDYASMHLVFVEFESAINSGACTSGAGVVVLDSNESSKAALSFALTALASGKWFQCYVTDSCSTVTGATATYPICEYYPTLRR
jgi:hypothetical protein